MQDFKKRSRRKRRGLLWRKRSSVPTSPARKARKETPGRLTPARAKAVRLPEGVAPLPRPPRARKRLSPGALALAGALLVRHLLRVRTAYAAVLLWVAVGLAYGTWQAWRGPLQRLEITGLETLRPAQVAAAAGLYPGVPMAEADPYGTAARVAALSRVRGVEVRRTLPGALRVAVTERRPHTAVRLADGAVALLDGEGVVLEVNVPPDDARIAALPRVRTAGARAVTGRRMESPALARGTRLLEVLRRTGAAGRAQVRVDARDPFVATVRLEGPGAPGAAQTLRVPLEQAGAALRAYRRLRQRRPEWMARQATVDLRAVERPGVSWVVAEPRAE